MHIPLVQLALSSLDLVQVLCFPFDLVFLLSDSVVGVAQLASLFPQDEVESIDFLPQQGESILILSDCMVDIAIVYELTAHFLDLVDKLLGLGL